MRPRPLGQLGVVTDIMQPSSGRVLLQYRGENLSPLGPRTYTAACHRGIRKRNQRSCRPIFGQRGMVACQAFLRLVTIDQGPTCLNEPASSFFPQMNGPWNGQLDLFSCTEISRPIDYKCRREQTVLTTGLILEQSLELSAISTPL